MRTLQIGMGAPLGGMNGLDRYFFDLVRSLPAAGALVSGYVSGDTAGSQGITCFAGQDASVLKRWAGLRSAIVDTLRETDVVVSHFALHAFGMLDQLRKKPLVIHFHGPWALESATEGAGRLNVTVKQSLERIVYKRGSRIIVLSQAFASILEAEYGVPRSVIRIVPGGVDLRRYASVDSRRSCRATLGWPLDRPTVVTVRRLLRAKGLENLIDATKLLRTKIPDIFVVIVGTGRLESELKARAKDAGLEDTIHFQGFVEENSLPLVYRAADIFVVPTIALEGFGLVVVEALACGTPVLVSPNGGLPEVVRDLDPQLILASAEPKELARGMCGALDGTMRLPSEAACRAYAARFDWPMIAARVKDVYAEAIG